jgi:Effector-associated domain 1
MRAQSNLDGPLKIQLRKTLSELFVETGVARIIVSDTQLPSETINYQNTSEGIWHEIIEAAERLGLIFRLLEVANARYPEHPLLSRLTQQICDTASPPVAAFRSQLPLQLSSLHHFDLTDVIDKCLPRIHQKSGLSGFTVTCPCDRLVKFLIDRIKEEMGLRCGEARASIINTIDGLRSVPSSLTRIRKMRPALSAQNIVCGVVVAHDEAVAELWREVERELGSHNERRFVLIAMAREAITPPPGMQSLPSPVFHEHHRDRWWREVGRMLGWDDLQLCEMLRADSSQGHGGELDMDLVYDDLEYAIDLINEVQRDQKRFHTRWSQRPRLGVP